jgi:Tn3 transposase DDE domain
VDKAWQRHVVGDDGKVNVRAFGDKTELVLSPLEALAEPASLIALRKEIKARMPRVDLPEILLKIAGRTGCMEAFSHLTERTARATDLTTSLCAVLLAEACNTGPEPFVRQDMPALRRDRLLWVDQHYVRDETLIACNAVLVAAQNRIALARTRCWRVLVLAASADRAHWRSGPGFNPRMPQSVCKC